MQEEYPLKSATRMTAAGLAVLLVTCGLVLPARATPGLRTILDCNFDGKAAGQVIGTGGPAVGEPISLNELPAVVRAAPFATPGLEMTEDWGFGARHLRFEFLNGAVVDEGTLNIAFRLYFQDLNNFTLYLREASFSAVSFLNLRFDADGVISLDDLDGPGNHAVGGYTTGVPIAFALNFDLNAHTYSFTADGVALVQDASIGLLPQGIGALLIGLDHDGDSAGTFFLDDLLVTATDVTEPVTPTTWGGVKALYAR